MMTTSHVFERTVKIQYHRDAASGGGRAKVTIPARIQREAGVEAGSFMAWTEQSGKLVAAPTLTPSLCTTPVYAGGRDQLFCLFPGVFWRKYQVQPGAEFHWRLTGKQASGTLAVPKLPRRTIRVSDKILERSRTVPLLRHQTRYRITIPAEDVQALNLNSDLFVCREADQDVIRCTPVADERMETTSIEVRKTGTQVEIPKLLCDAYDLFGKSCTWTLKNGTLTGVIQAARLTRQNVE